MALAEESLLFATVTSCFWSELTVDISVCTLLRLNVSLTKAWEDVLLVVFPFVLLKVSHACQLRMAVQKLLSQ